MQKYKQDMIFSIFLDNILNSTAPAFDDRDP